ncbi:hypothetical protein D3C87_1084320 [compost metagenome]
MKRLVLVLALAATPLVSAHAAPPIPGATAPRGVPAARVAAPVTLGIDVLLTEQSKLLEGKRIGLITNRAAVDGTGVSVLDRLLDDPRMRVAAILTPEHGLKADRQGHIASDQHEREIPIHSLYGPTKKPSPAMLEGLDILVIDLPDVGARFYTYASTMALAMQAARDAGIPFVVLDRPNPINGVGVEGFRLDPKLASFVGYYPIPVRHGMTMGEMARMFNGAFGIGCQLTVVPMKGWTRGMWFDATGLPWSKPSPAMLSPTTAALYPGICLFEASNVDCRMGDRPFERVGATWIAGEKLAKALNARKLSGVSFKPTQIGEKQGVELTLTDRDRFQAVRTGAVMLEEIQRLHPGKLKLDPRGFDQMAGNDALRLAVLGGKAVSGVIDAWERDAASFVTERKPYLLYD